MNITKTLPDSEFTVRAELEKKIDEYIMLESLGEICYDCNVEEYREYNLVSRSERMGFDFGGLEDIMTVYNIWKKNPDDKVLRIFLEYEKFECQYGSLKPYPTGVVKEEGLLMKILKEE